MRTLITLVLLLLSLHGWAQLPTLESREASLDQYSGQAYVDSALVLSRLFMADGNAHKTQVYAEYASERAAALQLKEQQAEAMYLHGKGLLMIQPPRISYKKEATRLFAEAFFLSNSRDLKIAILESEIVVLQQISRRDREVPSLNVLLATLKGELSPKLAMENPLFYKSKRANNVLKTVAAENKELAAQLNQLEEEQAALQEAKLEMEEELQAELLEKEARVMAMSEESAKAQLLLNEKQMLLDSLATVALRDSLALVNQAMLLQEQQARIDLQESQRNFLIALAAIVLLIAFGLLSRFLSIRSHNHVLEEKNKIIATEKERSENLLLNILPNAIAKELKERGSAQARHYDQVTVLFSDFQGFSKIAGTLPPADLVDDLDFCFRHFDAIVEEFGLEKIKTIGDAYMCAGGLPDPSPKHARRVILAALAMQTFLEDWKEERIRNGKPVFEARIGIHTGPIIAGVVGSKKFAYDIWGDTVNIAARMESSGEAGRVNISAATLAQVNGEFSYLHRGCLPVKNLGEIDMYFIEGKDQG